MKNKTGNSLFAIALITIGVLLVLQNFNLPFVSHINVGNIIGIFWPLFLLIPGLKMLQNRVELGGIILTVLGLGFLAENALELVGINFSIGFIFKFIWPAILIFLGLKILNSKKSTKTSTSYHTDDYESSRAYEDQTSNSRQENVHNITFNARNFNYTSENTPLGISKLKLNITFGGAEIYIEEGIQVILVGQYLFGGHEFFDTDNGGIYSELKESRYIEDGNQEFDRTIIINANVTFGGIEIKRK